MGNYGLLWGVLPAGSLGGDKAMGAAGYPVE